MLLKEYTCANTVTPELKTRKKLLVKNQYKNYEEIMKQCFLLYIVILTMLASLL